MMGLKDSKKIGLKLEFAGHRWALILDPNRSCGGRYGAIDLYSLVEFQRFVISAMIHISTPEY